MATAAQDIYETSPAQELYETSVEQAVRSRENGLHWLEYNDLACEAFREEWRALARDASEPNPFFEEWFLLPSLGQFDLSDRVQVAALFAEGELRGLLPVGHSHAYYGYLMPHASTWLHANTFCGSPLIAKGFERAFLRELLRSLDDHPNGALFLHLPAIPQGSQVERALEAVLAEKDRPAGVVAREERAMLQSELSSREYYEESLSKKRRKELARLRKRLGEEGELTFERQSGSQALGEWIDEFLSLESAGWKGQAGSAIASSRDTERMFRGALHGAARARKLERLALRIDGKPVAMLINFITPPGAFSFKTAYDERFGRYSPGFLLQQENLELLDRGDIAWCDSCAAEGHPMIERIWRQKRTMLGRNIAIGGGIRRRIFERLLRAETKKDTQA